jgi:hypothetical protein
MAAHPQQSVVVGKTRLMVPAQQITLVTNGVGGEQREGKSPFMIRTCLTYCNLSSIFINFSTVYCFPYLKALAYLIF